MSVYTPPASMDVLHANYRSIPPVVFDSLQPVPQAINQITMNPQTEAFPNPNVSPVSKMIFNLIISTTPDDIENKLSSSGFPSSAICTEEVLKLIYSSPSAAIKFFHWSSRFKKPSPHSWNLMVDLLGKSKRFEEMWDAIRSMKEEGVLSVTTFASVFSRYCSAGREGDAIMSFEVMEKYGIKQDVVALNSLLSAFCSVNKTAGALHLFQKVKADVPPDIDTYTILFEGCHREGNVAKAKTTFGEMVIHLGWSKDYSVAYDAFLLTLVKASHMEEAMAFLRIMKTKSCLPSLTFFTSALDAFAKNSDVPNSVTLWDTMVGGGALPDIVMYNSMIGLMCRQNDFQRAFYFLDEMVLCGAFPDFLTYNTIFECLIANKRGKDVSTFFTEMIKNECPPTHKNSSAAIHLMFEEDDPETAMEIWNFMLESRAPHPDESANEVLLGLCNLNRLEEVWPIVDEMFVRGIVIFKTTMEKLRAVSRKVGRDAQDMFDTVSKRWVVPS